MGLKRVIGECVDYPVVRKTQGDGTVKRVETRIVFGNEQLIRERLAMSTGNWINTSYVERSSATLRLKDAHLQRKTCKFSKGKAFLKAKLAIGGAVPQLR